MSITQAALPGSTATVIGLAAFGVVAFEASWLVVRHVAVMAHAGAHALTGLLLFRRVHGIELRSDATAGTGIEPATGLSSAPVALAGYLGPSGFGLGAAKLIELRHPAVVLYVVLALLAVLLIGLRRSFGLISVFVSAAVVFGLASFTPVHVQVISAYSIAWLLLLSGVRRVVDIGLRSDDGIRLRAATGLPHVLWSVFWLAATLAAAAEGAHLLIG
ncbi:MAG: M50 family metallopeptidase [Streptosporangiaceae bacterium]